MKMKAVLVPTSAIVCLLLCFNLNQVQAQSDGGISTGTKTTSVAYCDAKLPAVQKQLLTDANATCTTQTACVECMDRASNIVIAATLVVQPDNSECKAASDISTVEDVKSRGSSALPEARFTAQIIQSPCFAGGTNLEVYIPGYSNSSREFSFLWEIDGGKGGHQPTQQCVCGKTARVRVTRLATGESVTLNIKLNSTCADSGKRK